MEFIEIKWQSDRYLQEIDLRDRLLRAPLGLVFTAEDLQAEQHQLHFGMTSGDHLVACLVVVPLDADTAKIRQMCVDDSHQRQGIGSSLMIRTEKELIERGFQSVELAARDIAVGFYKKLGYEIEGEGFIEVTIPHFKMVKKLY